MKITNLENLAEAVKAARKKLGLTQSEVAFASNVGLRYIVDLEKGKPTCQIGKAIQVMNMLGIEINIE